MQHWYVYYKLPRDQVAGIAHKVRAMIDALGATTGVRGRLLQRLEDNNSNATLMEQYDGIEDGSVFATALTEAVRHAGLPPELQTQRCIERFGDL